MAFEEYGARALDHFLNPRNAGELPGASAVGTYTNPVCGDLVKLFIKVEEGRIVAARSKTFGCAAAIACSSALTELLVGRTIDEALHLRNEEVVRHLGGLPAHKEKCSLLAEQATRDALRALHL
ncbi:MAG: iron-sulfur cluster assembly scaffold protein [Planctomycetes bacterium]|nr:iron-sulfur cluster assembly scaffold protein [Planctomycetota bacterium]